MKRKLSNPKLLLSVTAISIAIMLVYSACQKKYDPSSKDPDSLIENARKWFVSEVVTKEKDMISAPYSVLPSNSPVRRFARMRGLNELLNWNKAREYTRNGVHYVITSVEQNIKPFGNKNFEAARSLVFFKDQSGKMQMNIIELLSSKGSSLGNNIQEIASIAFSNKYLNRNDVIQDVTASVVFYNESYSHEISFEIANGTWTKANVNIANKRGVPKKRAIPLMLGRTTCQTCQHWYLVGIWYDLQTGQVVDYEILDEWDECIETGGPPQGYGTDPTPPETPPQECIDQNQASLDELVNSASTTSETISYEISTISPITKNKNPKWTILQSGGFWKLVSVEKGVVKLIDVDENKWQWESLVHDKISKEGLVLGGEVAIESETGTPSFTAGTQNILYAGMELDYTVKYTATPIPCPPFDMILPPVYVNYVSTAIWPAKP